MTPMKMIGALNSLISVATDSARMRHDIPIHRGTRDRRRARQHNECKREQAIDGSKDVDR